MNKLEKDLEYFGKEKSLKTRRKQNEWRKNNQKNKWIGEKVGKLFQNFTKHHHIRPNEGLGFK